jgi:outer membrane protein assembly factor BamB
MSELSGVGGGRLNCYRPTKMNSTDYQPTDPSISASRSQGARARFHSGTATLRVSLTLTMTMGLGVTAFAADSALNYWPQWRGPAATGVAPQGDPPITWSETENVKWKVKIPGNGSSTPIIWGKQIFIQTAVKAEKAPGAENKPAAFRRNLGVQVFGQAQNPPGNNPPPGAPPGGGGGQRRRPGGGGGGREKPTDVHQFVLLSIDRETGQTLWQKTVKEEVPHEGHHRDHGFASHSPVTDGQHIYSWFGSRGVHCFDLKGGLVWKKEFGQQRTANGFGEGNSLALHDNILVVNWDHEGEDFIAAYDKSTGKELWRNPRDERTTWTTPLIVTHDGKQQVVVSASQRIRSYDLATGKLVWECGGMTANVIPTPVADFGMVYVMSGFRGTSLLAIRLGKTGDLTGSDAIAWKHDRSTPYVPSPLLYGERLYFFSHNNAILSCFNAKTGQALYDAHRLEGPSGIYASPVGAAGRVYLAGRNGTCLVLKDGDKVEVLATNSLADRFDASPAVSGNQLFLRGHENLYCISAK